jgi:hypothetical protein
MKKVLLILLALIVIGGAAGWYMYQKPVSSLENEDPVKTLTATELFEEFGENEQEAMKTYQNKVVEVSGKVIEQMENTDGSKTLILDGGDPIFGVKCRLDPSVETESLPQKGEEVRLKGLLIGMNADVEMNQCIIL